MNHPVVHSNETMEQALDLAAEGQPFKAIAKAVGVVHRTLWAIIERDAVFKESMRHARACGYQVIADSVLTLHEEFPDCDPQWLRTIGDNRKWYLKVMCPAIFGDKIQMQVENVDLKGALLEARTRVITIINPTG